MKNGEERGSPSAIVHDLIGIDNMSLIKVDRPTFCALFKRFLQAPCSGVLRHSMKRVQVTQEGLMMRESRRWGDGQVKNRGEIPQYRRGSLAGKFAVRGP